MAADDQRQAKGVWATMYDTDCDDERVGRGVAVIGATALLTDFMPCLVFRDTARYLFGVIGWWKWPCS